MAHENARAGFGKLFAAQILKIISLILIFVAVVLIAIATAISEGVIAAILGFAGIFFLCIPSVLLIIGLIVDLVGLSQAGKDEPKLKTAFILTIISLILQIVVQCFNFVPAVANYVAPLMSLVTGIMSLVVFYNVLFGAANLNPNLQDSASTIWKVIILLIILPIVAVIIGIIIALISPGVGVVVASIIYAVSYLLYIICYLMYVGFLAKARNEV